jgi:[ribosomal protein S5]-alanine N-acetyltransferase
MQILETSRLSLREFREDDAEALARVISDPETMKFYSAPFDRSGVEEWIVRNRRRYKNPGMGSGRWC